MRTTKTTTGDIVELRTTLTENREPQVRRLNKDEYLVCSTGEIRQYQNQGKSRSENRRSLYRTFAELRKLINANATNTRGITFLTLTYAENMTDPDRLTADYKRFWRRYKQYHIDKGYEIPRWVCIAEPQRRGAFHLHILFFYTGKRPFIPKWKIEKQWDQGFVNIKSVKRIDNLGAYLTPYLTDLIIDEDLKNCPRKKIGRKKKAVLKGGRVSLYKPGMKIYRFSRDCIKPTEEEITQLEADEFRKANEEYRTYRKVKEYKDPESGFETKIIKEQYNFARKKPRWRKVIDYLFRKNE